MTQNKYFLSKNGIARQYCISLEKENYNDIGTPLDFRQENTSESRRCCNVNTRSENRRQKHNVVTMLVFRCSNDVRNTTLWQRCDNVIRRRDQNTTKSYRCYNVVCQLGLIKKLRPTLNVQEKSGELKLFNQFPVAFAYLELLHTSEMNLKSFYYFHKGFLSYICKDSKYFIE